MSDDDSTINLDLTTDPLTWPAWDGAPATPDEWLLELRVDVERMRREPTTWQAERWRLQDLDELPSVEFAQRFVTMGAYLHFPDEKRGIPNQYIVRRMDDLVNEERNRQIRSELVPEGTSPIDPVRRKPGRPGWTQVTFWALYREARDRAGAIAPDKELAKEMSVGLQQLQRLVRRFGRPN